MDDRRVHCTIVPATGGSKIEIVRYDRAGKWWYETRERKFPLTVREASGFVKQRPAVIWHEGVPGGSRFDALVRQARLDADNA